MRELRVGMRALDGIGMAVAVLRVVLVAWPSINLGANKTIVYVNRSGFSSYCFSRAGADLSRALRSAGLMHGLVTTDL